MSSVLKIYNTLTKSKDELGFLHGELKMYTCGVTVYDDCHIGHARSLYIFEVIRRYLSFKGYRVEFIRNITDVDDKIINKAREWSKRDNLPLREAFDRVRKHYIESYQEDLKNLEIPQADSEPLATENIEEMIEFISGLIDKGAAYEAGGNVYFSIRKFPSYGKLSNKKIDELFSEIRIDADQSKKDPLDFALWKKAKQEEPYWESPWGNGRPGWHIECSVMSRKFLNTDTLDIHGGGRDLVFPHHENELAQSEALTNKTFARFWIHHGLLTINGQKMAKSLGNFVTIKGLLKEFPPDVVKLFFLSAHYSQPIDFTKDKMKEKKVALRKILNFMKKVEKREKGDAFMAQTSFKKVISPEVLRQRIQQERERFGRVMDDDFNTPQAVACLFEIIRQCNKVLMDVAYTQDKYLEVIKLAGEVIKDFSYILGLSFKERQDELLISEEEIDNSIKTREGLREQKMFKEADQVRKELEEEGIILEDTKQGTTWRRKI